MVSDSTCGGDHGGEVDVKECTQKCIRNGDKYVLATENGLKVIPIANQDFAGLPEHAGEMVTVTGDPAELTLWAMGRTTAARVRLDGSEPDVRKLTQADWRA